jgi:hypothetical protein
MYFNMDWERLYKEYLGRCKSNPLSYTEFVKLRETILHNKRMEEEKKKWFGYE